MLRAWVSIYVRIRGLGNGHGKCYKDCLGIGTHLLWEDGERESVKLERLSGTHSEPGNASHTSTHPHIRQEAGVVDNKPLLCGLCLEATHTLLSSSALPEKVLRAIKHRSWRK